MPDTKEKGFGIQGTLGFTKAQLSAWYALDSNFYFTGMVNGALSSLRSDTTKIGNDAYHAISTTFGLGYKKKLSPKLEFQIQGGGGASRGYFHTDLFSKDINLVLLDVDVQSYRAYLQPSFGLLNKHSTIYFIPRFSYENFNHVEQRVNKNFQQGMSMVSQNFLFGEGYILGRFFTKAVNIDLYFGLSGNLTKSNRGNSGDAFVVQPVTFGFGLSKTFY